MRGCGKVTLPAIPAYDGRRRPYRLARYLARARVAHAAARAQRHAYALRLNQTQPAISTALRKLRETLNDPILVRGKSGMVPTEYGASLLEAAQRAARGRLHRDAARRFRSVVRAAHVPRRRPRLPERFLHADADRALSRRGAACPSGNRFAESRARSRGRARIGCARSRDRQLAEARPAVRALRTCSPTRSCA